MAAPSLIGASADEALAVVRRDLNVLEAANGQATVAERRAALARAREALLGERGPSRPALAALASGAVGRALALRLEDEAEGADQYTPTTELLHARSRVLGNARCCRWTSLDMRWDGSQRAHHAQSIEPALPGSQARAAKVPLCASPPSALGKHAHVLPCRTMC